MQKIVIETSRNKEIIDITDRVATELEAFEGNGLCHLFAMHTSAALTTADLDPGTDLDTLEALDSMMPALEYRHPHDPGHVTDHILSSLIGPSLVVPVESGKPLLGTWQRIVFIELAGPRQRDLILTFLPRD